MIEKTWMMETGDINKVGESLGFDWNEICDEVSKEELYGQDGAGFIIVGKNDKYKSNILTAIFKEIFKRHTDMKKVYILNNC